MKKSVLSLLGFAFFLCLSLGACKHSHDHANGDGHNHDNDDTTEEVEADKTGKEYTSTYVCPMHCEGSGAEEAGTCPVCGMDYVLNEDINEDNHDHGDEGSDHDHDHGDDDHDHG